MKTGLLTFQDTNNFGSLLQTYALYMVITEHYSECEIINYRCRELYEREIPKSLTQLRTIKDIYRYILYHKKQMIKYNKLCVFSKKYMKSSPYLTKDNMKSFIKKYDKIIVGSDIVWGLDITGNDYTYFLDFTDKREKYSYAASFGSDYILLDSRKKKVGSFLSEFKLLAVREQDGCDIIRNLCGKQAELVLDPTLLRSVKEWEKILAERAIKQPYILTYFEDEQGVVKRAALELAKKYHKPVYNISNGKGMRGVNNISVYSIEDFLSYLYYADMVVTASYHGMAFSINFNKQFYFFNRCHKSRMSTLAQIFDLQTRELVKGKKIDDTEIDYDKVNEKIEQWRRKSYHYLDKVFENV